MVFFLLNCLGIRGSCRRGSNGAAAIPRFHITQIPDDGVNQLLKQKMPVSIAEDKSMEAIPALQPNTQVKRVSNWKPYHNASVAVSSALTSSATARQQQHSMNMILYEEGEYVKLFEENKKTSFVELKEEDQSGKFIRTPTPDALVTFNELECKEDIVSMPLINEEKDSVENEDFNSEVRENASLTIDLESNLIASAEYEALIELFPIGHSSADNLEPEVNSLPLHGEDANILGEKSDLELESGQPAFSEMELSLENLFFDPSEAECSQMVSFDDHQPSILTELRMPLRCKTRVTEMATWFEKQMASPDHNETFEN